MFKISLVNADSPIINEKLNIIGVTDGYTLGDYWDSVGDYPYLDDTNTSNYIYTTSSYESGSYIGGFVFRATTFPVGSIISIKMTMQYWMPFSGWSFYISPKISEQSMGILSSIYEEDEQWHNKTWITADFSAVSNLKDYLSEGAVFWFRDSPYSDGAPANISSLWIDIEYTIGEEVEESEEMGDFLANWFIYAIFLLVIPISITVYVGGNINPNPMLMLITFLGAETLMSAISLSIGLVDLWFMLVIIVIDVLIILGLMRGGD